MLKIYPIQKPYDVAPVNRGKKKAIKRKKKQKDSENREEKIETHAQIIIILQKLSLSSVNSV
jgi:hypothetical protein